MVLIQEKRIELEQYEGASNRECMVCSKEKWERISARLQAEGYDRDPEKCRIKWTNLMTVYKAVKLYDHSTGCGNYFALTTKERSAAKLGIIEKEAFDEIDEFLSAKPNITLAKLRDNSNRPPTRSGGSGSGSRSSNFGTSIENEDRGTAEEVHSPLLQQESLGDKEAGSTSRAKKKARRSDLLALVDVLKEGNEASLKMFTAAEETRLKLHQEQMELEKESIRLEQDRLAMEKETNLGITTALAAIASAIQQGLHC
ncbi:trihelix transcription factor GT-3b-like [Selaginella moellendorffii]|uniref:trihelix transcription factor GT-3b-like n=1 Tax=Selaginella moellendorffii TaxID=88036 RepID=UPI000D1C9864|nr:trihelix transcription factor GT-3b-like [Selaginella moellendorffii]|eukprot:XP_024529155.1 trihelix transcription factor GT-3b-like [Selaginella moellendorffii]